MSAEASGLYSYSVSVLRGKCTVMHCQDIINDVAKFVPNDDTFYYFLSYNPQNRRLGKGIQFRYIFHSTVEISQKKL